MRLVDQLARRVRPGQILLRTGVALGAGLAVLAADRVGSVPTWSMAVAGLLALFAVARPDSMAGLALLLWLGENWLTQSPTSVDSPWLLVAVAGVVIVHLGLLIAAQSPASAAPDSRQLLVWAVRGVTLWAGAAVVWAGAGVFAGTAAPTTVLIGALALLLVATVGTGLHLAAASSGSKAWRPTLRARSTPPDRIAPRGSFSRRS